ncbi:NfeD family protein [Nigerium sp.]|mgnify:CR=1 FL=1|uniref:NfeD family protein n=1 Tax=Nigerium sp. TaxID=2042655 RepID=UPI003222225A
MSWLLWLLAAVGLAIGEFFSLTLAFGILSGSALVAALVAGFGAPLPLQLVAFVVSTVLGMVVVRPVALRHMARPGLVRDGTDALVGRRATVVQEVSADAGLVHLAGEDWTARPYRDGLVIPRGASVEVMEIAGATAIVYPQDLPLTEG